LNNGKAPDLFASIVWSIWNQLNKVRLHQSCFSTEQIAQLAKDLLEEYKTVMPSPTIHPHKRRAKWLPPPQDFFKINHDGAVFPDENRSGIGAVIRNNLGLVNAS